jgi:hypothetical protein
VTSRTQISPDKRAALEASLEFGTHALLGQHLYQRGSAPTIPGCMSCGRKRVLYAGLCADCRRAEEREERDSLTFLEAS